MSNKVQEFLNENFGQVRAMEIDNILWFVVKDVAISLKYSTIENVTDIVDDDDIRILKENGVGVSHNIGANAKGAKGVVKAAKSVDGAVNGETDEATTESAEDFEMTKDFADILAAQPYEEACDTSELEEMLSGLI